MVDFTFSSEQIRNAPTDVRLWLERQIAASLGQGRPGPADDTTGRHLVGCDVKAARDVLALIQTMLPVVSVFFELAHETAAVTPQGLRALRLDDIQHHCGLQAPNQVMACLETINGAIQRISGDPNAALTAVDQAGHCFVAAPTARSIMAVWQEIVAAHDLPLADAAQADHAAAAPSAMDLARPAA